MCSILNCLFPLELKPEANELLLVGGGLFLARAELEREYLKSISIPTATGYCQYQCLESL